MINKKYYQADTKELGLILISKTGKVILSSQDVIINYGNIENYTVDYTVETTELSTIITYVYTNSKSIITVVYTLTDDFYININYTIEYLQDVEVIEESIIYSFAQRITQVYRKNRKMDNKVFQNIYWLDKEGCKIGNGNNSCLIYHTPNIAAMELNTKSKKLKIYLDNKDAHWFNHITANADTVDMSKSLRKQNDICEYSTRFLVGYDTGTTPRLMLNPSGYVAGFCWTEHADTAHIRSSRAAAFGSQAIHHAQSAIGGYVGHNLPITKSIFFYGSDVGGMNWVGIKKDKETGEDNEDFIELIDELYNLGYELCLHTPSTFIDNRSECLAAIQYMKSHYNTITWIDHDAPTNREDISSDGLDTTSDYYIKDYWETYETKYFWQYGSENGEKNGIDCLAIGAINGDAYPTPLYWRHPTRMGNFISWAADIVAASQYSTKMTNANIQNLVDNWGFSIIHTYSASANTNSTYLSRDENGFITTSEFAENMLQYMQNLYENGFLNVTPIRKAVDYWLLIEKVRIDITDDHYINIINNTGEVINGFSFVMDNKAILDFTGLEYSYKAIENDVIYWLDLPINGVRIPYKYIVENDNTSLYIIKNDKVIPTKIIKNNKEYKILL